MPEHVGYGRKVGDGSDEENMQKTDDLGRFASGSTNPESERTEKGANGAPRREDFKTRMEWIRALLEWKRAQANPKPEPEQEQELAKEQGRWTLPRRGDFDPGRPMAGFKAINSDMWLGSLNTPDASKWGQNCQRCYACFELWCRGYDVKASEKLPDARDQFMKFGEPFTPDDGFRYADLRKKASEGKPLTKEEQAEFRALRLKHKGSDKKLYARVFVDSYNEGKEFRREVSEKLKGTRNQPAKLFSAMQDKARENGIGSRYYVWVEYKSGGAHIFNAVMEKEGLRFYDAQDGSEMGRAQFESWLGSVNCSKTLFARIDDKEVDEGMVDYFVRKR